MVVTTSRGRLFISFGHSFEIFSYEGLLRSVDALYLGATTRKTKKLIFLSMKYRFTVIPGQSDQKKTKVDLFRKLDEGESECQYRQKTKATLGDLLGAVCARRFHTQVFFQGTKFTNSS